MKQEIERKLIELLRLVRAWQRPKPPEVEPEPEPQPPRGRKEIVVRYTPRDKNEVVRQAAWGEWQEEGTYRYREAIMILPVVNILLTMWEEKLGDSPVRKTLLFENCYPNVGVAYLESLAVNGMQFFNRDCIIPRGYLPFRLNGERYWQHLPEGLPESPPFADVQCRTQLARVDYVRLGPYKIGDPEVKDSSSLNGSHGAWRINRYRGGRDSWTAGVVSGWQLAEKWMLNIMSRTPIATRKPRSLEFMDANDVYWLGRTVAHELPEYREQPDDWCPYAKELFRFRAHGYTHMWRQVGDAAQIAKFDQLARHFLRATWHDCKMYIFNKHGAGHHNKLFWPLQYHIDVTPKGVGSPYCGRGFAHICGAWHEAGPWISEEDRETSKAALRAFIQHVMVDGTGVGHGFDGLDDYNLDMVPPVARAREVDLLGQWLPSLGLDKETEDWKKFMAPKDGKYVAGGFEIRPGMTSWADSLMGAPEYFPGYDALRGDITYYGGTVESLMEEASVTFHGVREGPLDWTDINVWRSRQRRTE